MLQSYSLAYFFLAFNLHHWRKTQKKSDEIQGTVCIIRYDHICFEKSSSTFWQVHSSMHRTRRSCQKFDEDFFQILWPSQKTQTLDENSYRIWPHCVFLEQFSPTHLSDFRRNFPAWLFFVGYFCFGVLCVGSRYWILALA